jgi:hypothetical protein
MTGGVYAHGGPCLFFIFISRPQFSLSPRFDEPIPTASEVGLRLVG